MHSLEALFFVYLFIAIGFSTKKFFKEKIDEKSLVLLSVYIFQPFLTFWGLLTRPIDLNLALAPLIFFALASFVIFINIFFAKNITDPKERSIFIVASVIGNTGNLGVPLALALFGPSSLAYTTIINLSNVFLVYTFGAYFYSRGHFDMKTSLLNTIKLPILWFALIAIFLNILHFKPDEQFKLFLQMGAYSGIVIQLLIFGLYLAKIRLTSIDWPLATRVLGVKFIFFPLISFFVISFLPLEPLAKKVLFLETATPLAVANVNLAALYGCKELKVTELIFVSSLLFIFLMPIYIFLMEHL